MSRRWEGVIFLSDAVAVVHEQRVAHSLDLAFEPSSSFHDCILTGRLDREREVIEAVDIAFDRFLDERQDELPLAEERYSRFVTGVDWSSRSAPSGTFPKASPDNPSRNRRSG